MTPRRPLVLALAVAVLAGLAALAAGCGAPSEVVGATGTTSGGTAAKPLALPASLVRFAVPPTATALPAGPYPGPATPTSLDGVRFRREVLDAGDRRFALGAAGGRDAVEATLARQGFVVLPSDIRQLSWAYGQESYLPWPVFVTTDVALNQLHLAFDKVLRTAEQRALLPRLEKLVAGLAAASAEQAVQLAGGPLEDASSRVAQLYQVAAAELGLPVELGPLAAREKALVDAHTAASETSPLSGATTDYSLYAPRGHYTRTAALRRYFTAMSVLGQAAFCVPGGRGCDGLVPARRGILAARVLARDPALVALWRQIYEPTAFLVGSADDYTPLEVAAAAGPLDDPAALAADDEVQRIAAALTAARPVRIDPEKPSIRIMGTRFVVDSLILDQLLAPSVGSSAKPRTLGSALDVAAAFGSPLALDALASAGKADYDGYDAQLAALRGALAARPEADWSGTVYDAWLHAIAPLWQPHGEQYPDFMRSPAWAAKALQTGLASYAELKHDTLLYTKQGLAEGGGDEPPAPRRNWVEPEPVVFGRVLAATTLLRDGLRSRGLLDGEDAKLLADEIDLLALLRRVAAGELAGEPISAEDNDSLTYVGDQLDWLFQRSADQDESSWSIDLDGAIVADIESGPEGVLEIGTGRVGHLLVLVPDDAGRFELAVGAVSTFYEFTSPPGERLTDEEWRARLDQGTAPAPPAWTAVLGPSAG